MVDNGETRKKLSRIGGNEDRVLDKWRITYLVRGKGTKAKGNEENPEVGKWGRDKEWINWTDSRGKRKSAILTDFEANIKSFSSLRTLCSHDP